MEPKIQKLSFESQSSLQMVASVDDLLIEIFLRLPVKSLIRFKSVSKHWQSLISDPGFTILRNPNPNPATGLILPVDRAKYQRPDEMPAPYAYIVSINNKDTSAQIRTLKMIDVDPWPCATIIKSSCNGLILMCRWYKNSKNLPVRHDYYVCNPTTNKYFKFPQTHYKPDWMLLPMCLAFDPSKSPHYKVVCVQVLKPDHTYSYRHQFLVYSSETGCWRISCVEPLEAASVDFKRGVYWNGAIHWVSLKKTGKSIYFDPDDDRMSLEIMPTPQRKNRFYYFGESCGHLHFINERYNWMFDVYELKRDYSEWFVKYRINHHDPCSLVGGHMPYLCAVVRGKSHDDDSFSVFLIGGKLVRYYFLNKTLETICEVESALISLLYLPLQHAESLHSV